MGSGNSFVLSSEPIWSRFFMQDGVTEPQWILAHRGRDKMDAISQTTFSNTFSWIKMFEFRLKFHGSLFPRVQLTRFQQWVRWWLDAVQATSHYLNQWWLVYRRLNELSHCLASQIWVTVDHTITWCHKTINLYLNLKIVYLTRKNIHTNMIQYHK